MKNYEILHETSNLVKALLAATTAGLGFYGLFKSKTKKSLVDNLSSRFDQLKRSNPIFRRQWAQKYGELKNKPVNRQKSDKEIFKDWVTDSLPDIISSFDLR
jgi:hypothetical protein